MQIVHKDDGKKGSFYIENDGLQVAAMTYTYAGPNKIIIDHIEVSDQLKGQRVGYKLIDASVQFMRAHNLTAIPLCPFAKAVFTKKRNEYADVSA